jgi:hypothetical protein
MTNVEIVLYTTLFSSVLTTLLAIGLKRFDSKEAENNRKLNDEIAKLDREYEINTTLRDKYEKLLVTFGKYRAYNAKLIINTSPAEFRFDKEYFDLTQTMTSIVIMYFKDLIEPLDVFFKKDAKIRDEIHKYFVKNYDVNFSKTISTILRENDKQKILEQWASDTDNFNAVLNDNAKNYNSIKSYTFQKK